MLAGYFRCSVNTNNVSIFSYQRLNHTKTKATFKNAKKIRNNRIEICGENIRGIVCYMYCKMLYAMITVSYEVYTVDSRYFEVKGTQK